MKIVTRKKYKRSGPGDDFQSCIPSCFPPRPKRKMVASKVIIDNQTTKDITEVVVTDVHDFDFWRDYGTPLDFNGQGVRSKTQLDRKAEMYLFASNCPFHMKLIFEDGSTDSFKIRQSFARPDDNDVLTEADKKGVTNAKPFYCICKRSRLSWTRCPHLIVDKNKTHDIYFKREMPLNDVFAIRIQVKNTPGMDALENALDKDKDATKYYNGTKEQDLDAAAKLEQEAIDALAGIKEHQGLQQEYQAKLNTIKAEKNAKSTAPDTLSALNKMEKDLQEAIDTERSEAGGDFHAPAESILNQLQIKKEAVKYAEYAKQAKNDAEAAVNDLTQSENFEYIDIEKLANKYREAEETFGSSLHFFQSYASLTQSKNEAMEEAELLLEATRSAYHEVKKMQLVYAIQEIGIRRLVDRPQFNGDDMVEINAETVKGIPQK